MKTPAISIGRLAAFVAVAEAGSFTAAAERLDTTKSALSRSVSLLERELGTQLLQRSTRKLAITEAGEAFLADCRTLLGEAQAIVERARTGRAQPTGTLRLTSPHASAAMVAAWIAAYRERHPGMRIDYVPTDRTLDLIAERFDLAIRIGTLSDSALHAVVLEELEVWTCAAPAYLERHGTPRKPQDLPAHEWIALSLLPTPWTVEYASRAGAKVRVRLKGSISAASNEAVYSLVLQGAGIAGFPALANVRADVAAGRLVRLCPTWGPRRVVHYAAYPGSVAPPAKTRAFIDIARAGRDGAPPRR
jgi:DNA-binding transcriptional LysR family regulator